MDSFKPQARLASVPPDVNRYAHLAAPPIVVPDEAVAVEVHSGVAVGRYDATTRDRFDPRQQVQQQRVGERRVDDGRGGRNVVVPIGFAAPLVEEERLVDDACDDRLEEPLRR
jgi:hypothetical protein